MNSLFEIVLRESVSCLLSSITMEVSAFICSIVICGGTLALEYELINNEKL